MNRVTRGDLLFWGGGRGFLHQTNKLISAIGYWLNWVYITSECSVNIDLIFLCAFSLSIKDSVVFFVYL